MALFHVLGQVAAGHAGRRVALGSRLRRLLLAMLLARPNRVVSSDRLIDALWPEDVVDAARNRLWFHASKLRTELADASLADRLETHDVGYRVAVTPDELDAQLFEREAVAGAGLVERDPERAAVQLRDALDRWEGPAFGDAGDHPALSAEVVRLEALRMQASEDLAEALIRTEHYDEAIRLLRELIDRDPYREGPRSQLMLALYANGRQVEALDVYDASIALLREDLGLDPSPMLRATGLRILSHDPTLLTRKPPTAPRIDFPPRTQCVGREQTLREIATLVTDSGAHSPVVLVSGEAGSGKTSLLAEAAQRTAASNPGWLVATGVGVAAPGLPDDFGPLRQILGALVGDLESSVAVDLMTHDQVDALWQATPSSLDALLDTSPGLLGTLIDSALVRARAAAVGWGRAREFDALEDRARKPGSVSLLREMVAFLKRISSIHPTILVLDDLHRANRATIETIAALARSPAPSSPIVLAAFRPVAASIDGWAEMLGSLGASLEVDLDSPDEAEQRRIVDALVDLEENELGDDFRAELQVATAGKPLFVIEWLRSLIERGDLVRSADGVLHAESEASFDAWPREVEGVMAERLSRFTPQGRHMLRIAAVEGEAFSADVVAAVAGCGREDAVAFLSSDDDARRHIVTADVPGRIGSHRTLRYRFTHQLYQRYLYETLDRAERSLLHEQVAAALEELGGASDDSFARTLADHFVEAGLVVKAAHYLRVAADRRTRSGDNRGAVALLDKAQSLIADLPDVTVEVPSARLKVSRGIALSALSGFTNPEVERSFAEAIEAFDDHVTEPDARRASWGLCAAYLSRAAFAEADALLERLAGHRDSPSLPAMPILHLQWSLELFRGRIERALEHLRRGRDGYRFRRDHPLTFEYGNHDPGVCARSLGSLALALRGQHATAAEWATDARDLAASLDHTPSASQAKAFTMWIEHVAGRYETVLAFAEEPSSGSVPLWDTLADGLAAHASAQLGGEDVTLMLDDVLERQLVMKDLIFATISSALLASEWLRLGEPRRATDVLHRCRSAIPNVDEHFWAPEILRLEGLTSALLGRRDEGTAHVRRGIELAAHTGAAVLEERGRAALAQVT